jgi:SAM-dependent methyltransferase
MEPAEYARMDVAEARMWWYRALHARISDALDGVAGRFLDAGCGTGGLLDTLHRRHPALALTGVEWAAPAASRARAKSGAAVARGSVNALPFATAAFDAAIAADVLCHKTVALPTALTELHRVLRPGGRLVVNVPAFQWLHSAHDRRVHNARRWTKAALRADLQRAGFTQVHTGYWNSLLLPLMVVRRKVLASGNAALSDTAEFSPWLDAMLHAVTAVERRLDLRLPAGGSILATAIRSDTTPAEPT